MYFTALADWHQRTAAQVRADTLRLHILANSDTWDDQLLKLQVRDAVLAAIPGSSDPGRHPAAGRGGAANRFARAAKRRRQCLHRAHTQPARLRLERFAFAARDYGGFALPGRGVHSPAH